jgi:hypothetical protein
MYLKPELHIHAAAVERLAHPHLGDKAINQIVHHNLMRNPSHYNESKIDEEDVKTQLRQERTKPKIAEHLRPGYLHEKSKHPTWNDNHIVVEVLKKMRINKDYYKDLTVKNATIAEDANCGNCKHFHKSLFEKKDGMCSHPHRANPLVQIGGVCGSHVDRTSPNTFGRKSPHR